MAKKPRVIAIEEHYLDRRGEGAFQRRGCDQGARRSPSGSTISAICASRRWTSAGIDMQVLSHGAPSLQKIDRRDRGAPGARRQ